MARNVRNAGGTGVMAGFTIKRRMVPTRDFGDVFVDNNPYRMSLGGAKQCNEQSITRISEVFIAILEHG